MAVIAYTQRNITKNVWSIMYGGSNDFAMTSFNAINISNASYGIAVAIGDGSIVEGSNSAFHTGNSEVVISSSTPSILLDDSVPVDSSIYWTSDSGKIILPAGKQLVVAVTGGPSAQAEISMFGLEL